MDSQPTGPPPKPPVPRWHHSRTWLDDLAIVTWAVDPEVLAASLPDGFEPLTWPRAGTPVALVSMVAFRDRDFHFRFWPHTRLQCGQINYRAYVRHGGLTGVWFYGTSLDSRLVAVAQRLWRMPWHHDRIDVAAQWAGDRLTRMTVQANGPWGDADLDLTQAAGPVGSPPIPDLAMGRDLTDVLTDPVRGWFRRTDGRVGRYSVAHPPMLMSPATVGRARSAVFERLGLVTPDAAPLDARATRAIRFEVHTPPRQVPLTSPSAT